MVVKRKPTPVEKPDVPNLTISRKEAAEKILSQINKGMEIRDIAINSMDELKNARSLNDNWYDYNLELLRRIFDSQSIADSYHKTSIYGILGDSPLPEQVRYHRDEVQGRITRLESVLNRLELIPEPVQDNKAVIPSTQQVFGHDVFIVHGRDDAAKETVARYIEKLKLKAVILHEQPDKGRTIIEKFIDHSTVGFAVVILTPDDLGCFKDNPGDLKPRARQNVIFELGYFIGKLGRDRVLALHKGDVEIISDFDGVLYKKMDDAGAWRLLVAKEIKACGISIDLNDAI